MRRRRLFNLAAALSLLLCLAACAIWVRSYFVSDAVTWTGQGRADGSCRLMGAQASLGGILLVVVERPSHSERSFGRAGLDYAPGPLVPPTQVLGSHAPRRWAAGFAEVQGDVAGFPARGVVVPIGWLALAAALPGTLLLLVRLWRRRRRARRLAAGLCTRCGYDVRATPGHCPECGAAPTASR